MVGNLQHSPFRSRNCHLQVPEDPSLLLGSRVQPLLLPARLFSRSASKRRSTNNTSPRDAASFGTLARRQTPSAGRSAAQEPTRRARSGAAQLFPFALICATRDISTSARPVSSALSKNQRCLRWSRILGLLFVSPSSSATSVHDEEREKAARA